MQAERRTILAIGLGVGAAAAVGARDAMAASAREIDSNARAALQRLYAVQPKAHALGEKAEAILVFPRIYKAGLLIGGESGDGVLWVKGRVAGYYNLSAASFGLQLGAQAFSYALFFMNRGALDYLRQSGGWSVGSGPSVVVMDKGAAASMSTTTLTQDVYAFPFGQQGLMGGLGLQGSKITRIHPS